MHLRQGDEKEDVTMVQMRCGEELKIGKSWWKWVILGGEKEGFMCVSGKNIRMMVSFGIGDTLGFLKVMLTYIFRPCVVATGKYKICVKCYAWDQI